MNYEKSSKTLPDWVTRLLRDLRHAKEEHEQVLRYAACAEYLGGVPSLPAYGNVLRRVYMYCPADRFTDPIRKRLLQHTDLGLPSPDPFETPVFDMLNLVHNAIWALDCETVISTVEDAADLLCIYDTPLYGESGWRLTLLDLFDLTEEEVLCCLPNL